MIEVEVPGVGIIEFPDSVSADERDRSIREQFFSKPKKVQPPPIIPGYSKLFPDYEAESYRRRIGEMGKPTEGLSFGQKFKADLKQLLTPIAESGGAGATVIGGRPVLANLKRPEIPELPQADVWNPKDFTLSWPGKGGVGEALKMTGEQLLGMIPLVYSTKELIAGRDPLKEHPLLTTVDVISGMLLAKGIGGGKPTIAKTPKIEPKLAPEIKPAEISPELPSLGSEMIKSKSANVTIQSALADLERTVEKLGPTPPKVNKAGIPTEISPEGKIVTKPQERLITETPEGVKVTWKFAKPEEGGTALYTGLPIPEMFRGFRKERKFVTSVKEKIPEASKVQGQYIPRATDPLAQKARTLIQEDFATADRIARTGTDEVAVATSSELIKRFNDLAQNAPPEQAMLYYDKVAEYANIIAPKLTELGRSVQAASILGRMTPEGQVRFAAGEIARYNERITARGWGKKVPELSGEQTKFILEKSKRISAMPDGVEKAMAFRKLQDHISDLVPTPLYRKLINLWKAGLLTGIKTSGLNTFSNLFHGVSEVIKDIPALAIDNVASLFTAERTLGLTTRGVMGGVKEGFGKGWRYLKTGFDERNVGLKLDYRRIGYGKSGFAKALQTYEQSIFKLMGAEDQPFYYGAKARSLQSQAIAQAKNSRLKGIEAKKFIDELLENPTDDMLKYAVTDAEVAVFQNRTFLGGVAKAIQKTGVGEFVVPFGRTPAAVAMQLVNYSPVGIVKTIVESIAKGKFDQRLFSQAMGRGITGTAVLYIGTKLFEKGLITLNYPKGEKEKKQWELEGKKPNSIKIGGAWRNINVFGPAGMVLLSGGHFKRGIEETGSVFGGIAQGMAGGAKSLSEQTFLKGLNSAVDALNDPSRFLPNYVTGFTGSIIPTIVGDVARATDVAERRIESPLQAVKARIPGLRQTLEPRITTLGEELERGGSFLETMIDPTRPSKIKDTPLVAELKRLWEADYKVTPTLLGDKKGYEGLTPEQNTRLWQLSGQTTQTVLEALIQTPVYANLSDEQKGGIITKVINKGKLRARAMLLDEAVSELTGEAKKDKFRELAKSGMVNRDVILEYAKLKTVEK